MKSALILLMHGANMKIYPRVYNTSVFQRGKEIERDNKNVIMGPVAS
jgi:hypothetical protein